ncbi:MAG: phospholipase D family protein [Verrucomicrobiales bacterium]|nr:phospholipase D family protein [Verrucomicrobiales bacterium]
MSTTIFHYSLLILIVISLTSCATAPPNDSRTASYALPKAETSSSSLTRHIRKESAPHDLSGKSGARLLVNGTSAFVARMLLVEQAQKSLDLQYYIWNADLSGRLLTHQLLKAADRGVRVRVLLDDMVFAGRDANASLLGQHPNIELRIYNPFSRKSSRLWQMATRMKTITRRMHNKTFTADGSISILGGRNIGDEYFNANHDLDYGDLDVMVIGPVVEKVENSFDRYWNSQLAYPISTLHPQTPNQTQTTQLRSQLASLIKLPEAKRYRVALENSQLASDLRNKNLKFEWTQARIVVDAPEKTTSPRSAKELHLTTQLKPYFDHTQKELILISPYFVPTKKGTAFLCKLSQQGTRVRILTNSLASTDVAPVHAGYRKYRKALLAAGIELYEVNDTTQAPEKGGANWLGEVSKSSLHAKSFIFDRQQIFIGSYNFDPRSAIENTEIGIILDSPIISSKLAILFEQQLERGSYRLELSNGKLLWHQVEKNGNIKTYHKDPHTTFFQRLAPRLMGLLPIEWLL